MSALHQESIVVMLCSEIQTIASIPDRGKLRICKTSSYCISAKQARLRSTSKRNYWLARSLDIVHWIGIVVDQKVWENFRRGPKRSRGKASGEDQNVIGEKLQERTKTF